MTVAQALKSAIKEVIDVHRRLTVAIDTDTMTGPAPEDDVIGTNTAEGRTRQHRCVFITDTFPYCTHTYSTLHYTLPTLTNV